jgi:hypothetical protein
MHNLIIIIPSYNEKNLLNVVKKLKQYNILIIDDGSEIKVKKNIIETSKIKIIRNPKNRGYEYSLIKGFEAAVNKSKYILTMDADGEHIYSNVSKFYNYANKHKIDLLIGSRSRLNRLSEKFISMLFLKKFKIKDPLSGFKIYDSKKLKKIIKTNKFNNDFLVDLIKVFIQNGLKVKNYNIKSSKKNSRKSRYPYIKTNLKILTLIKHLR